MNRLLFSTGKGQPVIYAMGDRMKENGYWELPEGYRLDREVKLGEDRKTMIRLAVIQVVLLAAMIAAALPGHPVRAAFSMGTLRTVAAYVFTIVGILVYCLGHEWVHGVFIRLITGRSAEFGLELKKGMAYASSKAYFPKLPYIVIALAPLAVWTAVLGVLLGDVPENWFWYLYVIQMVNVTGAAGDLYVTWLTLRAPKGTLIQDSGTEMRFYAPNAGQERKQKETER